MELEELNALLALAAAAPYAVEATYRWIKRSIVSMGLGQFLQNRIARTRMSNVCRCPSR